MKKLMIAVAAIAVGMVANAANFAWSSIEFDVRGTDGNLVSSGYTGWLMNNATVALNDAIAAADMGNFSFISKNINDGGEGAEVADALAGGTSNDTLSPLSSGDYYVVLIDAMSANNATKAYFTGLNTVALDQYGSVASTSDNMEMGMAMYDFASTAVGDNWHGASVTPPDDPTEDIPEPTSGLLLLVGLAGMALKRKVA